MDSVLNAFMNASVVITVIFFIITVILFIMLLIIKTRVWKYFKRRSFHG